MLSKEELQEMTVVYGNKHNACKAATELLSLREQLEVLKNRKPDFFLLKTPYQDAWGDTCDLRCYEDELDSKAAKDDFGGVIIPLFTAAKPAEE